MPMMDDAQPAGLDGAERQAVWINAADVARRADWQVRVKGTDPRRVKDYADAMERGAKFPPITVARIGATLVLVDGWHRLEAVDRIDRPQVLAHVRDMTEQEAQFTAVVANLTHGKALTRADHRKAFRAYLRSGQHRKGRRFKSYREMAADLKGVVSYKTLQNWMRQDAPAVYNAKGKDAPEFSEDSPPEFSGGPPAFTYPRPPSPAELTLQALRSAVAEARSITSGEERKWLAEVCRKAADAITHGQPWPVEDEVDPW